MRSLRRLIFKASALLSVATAGGCLVSDEPMLDARTGAAAPLADGVYRTCPVGESEDDCETFTAQRGADGLYVFSQEGDDAPARFRFRRVARAAYAGQAEEDASYTYYFAKGDSKEFTLIMMQCPSLPERLRAKLIRRGDLETDDEDFETCTVKRRAGLVAAAQAYARGQVDLTEHPMSLITPSTAPTTTE